MSIVSEIARINNNISAAYSACQDKNAELPVIQNSANLANTIRSIAISNSEIEEKDINFYDYDGTLLYSYTTAEASILTELPSIPYHSNLVANKWTETLNNVKTEALLGNPIDIGPLYNTVNGYTYLYLTVQDSESLNNIILNFSLRNGTLSIVIGDTVVDSHTANSSTYETYTPSFNLSAAQTYPAEYIIKLSFEKKASNGAYQLTSPNGNSKSFFCYDNSKKRKMLRKIYIGSNCNIGSSAFQGCDYLETITLTETSGNIGGNTFRYCSALKAIIMPDTITSIGANSAQYCYSLKKIILPKGNSLSVGSSAFGYCRIEKIVLPKTASFSLSANMFQLNRLQKIIFLSNNITRIQGSCFAGNQALEQVKIPNSVTLINGSVFSACSNLSIIDLTDFSDSSSIPELEKTNAFSGIAADAVFYVKNQEMLTAFTSASVWSEYASKFQIKTN